MVEHKIERFAATMLELLQLERDAEVEETAELLQKYSFKELEKRSLAITKLFVRHVSTGVYGRVLVHLHRRTENQTKLRVFSPGDIVGMYEAGQ
jgi:kynureninase